MVPVGTKKRLFELEPLHTENRRVFSQITNYCVQWGTSLHCGSLHINSEILSLCLFSTQNDTIKVIHTNKQHIYAYNSELYNNEKYTAKVFLLSFTVCSVYNLSTTQLDALTYAQTYPNCGNALKYACLLRLHFCPQFLE